MGGEQVFDVRPLDTPTPGQVLPPSVLAAFPAVALFVERVQVADRRFALTPAIADPMRVIVTRLEGLPLGIELAAARLPSSTAAALACQLDLALATLIDGPRDLPARQRTLRATIAWSYDLLAEQERRLFQHLAVVSSSFDVAAASAPPPRRSMQQTRPSARRRSARRRCVRGWRRWRHTTSPAGSPVNLTART